MTKLTFNTLTSRSSTTPLGEGKIRHSPLLEGYPTGRCLKTKYLDDKESFIIKLRLIVITRSVMLGLQPAPNL